MFAIVGEHSRQKYANRAQQVVLACATWDPEGRLMVTPDGSLPCRKITDSFMERVSTLSSSHNITANRPLVF